MTDKALVYIHGKGGTASASEQFKRQERRKPKEYINPDQDEYFYFIAGYTSGGVPYGITWEQARKDGLIEEDDEDYDEELPFQ